ncbi:MAG: CopG family antitoxin [Neisseria animaloris]|nr:CopG family antitoxin [Neisseria animaloris]
MMQNSNSTYDNTEKWENGELGCSEEYAKASNFTVEDLQKAIELQPISLRINKDLLEDLKQMAKIHGIGYQPLIKQILRRFVDGEKRRLANEYMSELHARMKEEQETKGMNDKKYKVG